MANAWCINAIWFDWTLIQTLQQLDSANIWVWIQYTAPSPLDDKRLDYIKYTDKCWNTCCITWENELLIYATQWVIKNLTLTNDDTNEVVNVKRTDLFWSNRKKTVVRYKTWWYPTSITDWTLAVEELVQNQYQSSWYNVSWLSDWTTYYFTAFAVAQDDTIIVVQSNSITTDFDRSPTSDTLAYYRFNSNITDKSWMSTPTSYWTLAYQTYTWTTWILFNNSTSTYLTLSWIQSIDSTNFTISFRVYFLKTGEQIIVERWTAQSTNRELHIICRDTSKLSMWFYWNDCDSNVIATTWVRYNITCTYNSSSKAQKVYINWSLSWSHTWSWTPSFWTWVFYIWWRHVWANTLPLYWVMSRLIIEKKERSASDTSTYVNKFKSQYWLS